MSAYDEKRASRLERLEARITKLKRIASTNDLSLYGEAKSGIPLGQPILVGHHSERRHRRHLERIERLVRRGYDAGRRAEELQARLFAAKQNNTIQVDNPDALDLLKAKLQRLETNREQLKRLNVHTRASKGDRSLLAGLLASDPLLALKESQAMAAKLLTPDFAGRIGIPAYELTNLGVTIRQVKQRIASLPQVQAGFEPFTVGPVAVELVDGQIQLEFPWKPCEGTRSKIKRLAFKWSRYSGRWVRKHTASTTGDWFKRELINALEDAHE